MIFIRTIVRSNVNGAFRGDIIQSIFLLFLLNNICGYIYIFVYDFIQIDRANVHYWIEHAAYIEYESCLSECHLAIGTITNVSRVWVALLLFPHLPKYLHLWQSSSFHNLLIWLQEKSETLVVQDWIMNKKKKKTASWHHPYNDWISLRVSSRAHISALNCSEADHHHRFDVSSKNMPDI